MGDEGFIPQMFCLFEESNVNNVGLGGGCVFHIDSQTFSYRDQAANLHLMVKKLKIPKTQHYFSRQVDTVHFAN